MPYWCAHAWRAVAARAGLGGAVVSTGGVAGEDWSLVTAIPTPPPTPRSTRTVAAMAALRRHQYRSLPGRDDFDD
ncbi:MAG: hypothetical protein M3Z84_00385 [Actinomycetota bacterium]|nr:hypothetical protein [Actinomycetota bacterium]